MQIDEILSRFRNVKRTGDRQYIACCPAHDDAKQSLSIGAGDGKILLNCFAGCDTRDIVAAVGLTMKDLYTDHSGSTYTPPATLPKKKPVSQRQGAKPAAYTHSKEYIYTDEDGAFIARKIKRYDDSGNKTFAWKTFDADGNEINGNGVKGSPMYLYNIAELCRNRDALAADGIPVYIVEGEKDVDTVRDMSLVAVSLPNGASSTWKVIDEAYKLLKTDKSDKCRIEESEFNADANIINFRNGLLNVETLELMPHTPDALSTIQLPCDWNPNAPTPKRFIEFMNTLSGGDEGKKQLMLEYCGVAVSNIDASLPKKCLFLVGPGDTGKSKLLELLVMLLGKDNYTELKLQNLEKDVHATFDLWGKRLAGSPDMQYAKVAELAIFKTLSGGDNINFNRKYADSFSGKFKGIIEQLYFSGKSQVQVGAEMNLSPERIRVLKNAAFRELRKPKNRKRLSELSPYQHKSLSRFKVTFSSEVEDYVERLEWISNLSPPTLSPPDRPTADI